MRVARWRPGTVDRLTVPLPVEADHGKGRRWWTGLLTGMVVGVGILLAGPMVGLLGIAAVLTAAANPREAAVGGALVGFGAAWLVLFLTADARCGTDCVGPDLTPWLVLAAAAVALGSFLTYRARKGP